MFGGFEAPGPLPTGAGGMQLFDLEGGGRLDLVSRAGPVVGYASAGKAGWEPLHPFDEWPELDWDDPELRLVDLDGDGLPDVLLLGDEAYSWYRSAGRRGFEAERSVPWAGDESRGPRLVQVNGGDAIFLADMNGDGLADLVRVRNGEICYWPGMGWGRFGPRVTMLGAPRFVEDSSAFDPTRVRLWDLDGSGPADLVYLHADGVTFWFNESGNTWAEPTRLTGLPAIHSFRTVQLADLLGTGTAGSPISWSSRWTGSGS